MADPTDVLNACKALIDPNTGKDFVTQKSIRNVKVDGDKVSLELVLGYPAQSQHDAFREQIIGAVRALPGVANVSVMVRSEIVAHGVQRGHTRRAGPGQPEPGLPVTVGALQLPGLSLS